MKSKMVDNTPQTPVVPESSSTDFWSSSLDLFPKITMKDVEAFVNVNKSPKSGLTKGYKFFVEELSMNFKVRETCIFLSFCCFCVFSAGQRKVNSYL